MRLDRLLLSLLLTSTPAAALDPGVAQGSLLVNGETIVLDHACAVMHDNAEGLLEYPRELRILVSDREVSPDALYGVAYLPVEKLAKLGKLHGILISIDPANQSDVTVTVLYPPPMPGQSLLTEVLGGGTHDAVKGLKISAQRVVGEVEHEDRQEMEFMDIPKLVYKTRFSAPLFHETPVTADLSGKAAVDSPQARVLRAKVAALANGDFAALKRVSTESANRRSRAFIDKAGQNAISQTGGGGHGAIIAKDPACRGSRQARRADFFRQAMDDFCEARRPVEVRRLNGATEPRRTYTPWSVNQRCIRSQPSSAAALR